MIKTSRITRRRAIKLGAAATALPLVHIRTAGAAGKLNVGPWDHWVPAGNEVLRKQMEAWAEKNKVELRIDFITSQGGKQLITINAEAQAKTGHDMLSMASWVPGSVSTLLEPMDDVMGRLTAQYGKTNPIFEYMGKFDGKWLALPTSWGTQNKGPAARISVMKEAAGIDLQAMYPAQDVRTELSKQWTVEAHLKAAEACAKIGMHFAIGLGTTADSVDTLGGLFAAFGAQLVDAKGNMQIRSDAVAQALEYCVKLAKVLPADAISFDDASNNKALIAGKSALIWNPPSAWAVAKRDAPAVAADTWHIPAPLGPKGRFMPFIPNYWAIWSFSQNKTAAKELLEHLSQREMVRERATPVEGYDLPPFQSMTDFPVWNEVGPPKGTVFNYPVRAVHDQVEHLSGFPAPPEVGVKMYQRGTLSNMVARLLKGQPMKEMLSWAENEVEGFMRG